MAIAKATISGLTNDTEYGVRGVVEGAYGYQTALEGATARATPRAGIRLGDMSTNPPAKVALNESGVIQRFKVLAHDFDGNIGRTMVMREYSMAEGDFIPPGTSVKDDGLFIGGGYDISCNAYLDRLQAEISAQVTPISLPCQNNLNNLSSVGTYQQRAFFLSLREAGAVDSALPSGYTPTQIIPAGDSIPYFSTPQNRVLTNSNGTAYKYMLRDLLKSSDGYRYFSVVTPNGAFNTTNGREEVYYAVCFTLPSDMLFSLEPNPDGSYSPIL